MAKDATASIQEMADGIWRENISVVRRVEGKCFVGSMRRERERERDTSSAGLIEARLHTLGIDSPPVTIRRVWPSQLCGKTDTKKERETSSLRVLRTALTVLLESGVVSVFSSDAQGADSCHHEAKAPVHRQQITGSTVVVRLAL